jgi:hypothetical protein
MSTPSHAPTPRAPVRGAGGGDQPQQRGQGPPSRPGWQSRARLRSNRGLTPSRPSQRAPAPAASTSWASIPEPQVKSTSGFPSVDAVARAGGAGVERWTNPRVTCVVVWPCVSASAHTGPGCGPRVFDRSRSGCSTSALRSSPPRRIASPHSLRRPIVAVTTWSPLRPSRWTGTNEARGHRRRRRWRLCEQAAAGRRRPGRPVRCDRLGDRVPPSSPPRSTHRCCGFPWSPTRSTGSARTAT